jgi:hypothetical protein
MEYSCYSFPTIFLEPCSASVHTVAFLPALSWAWVWMGGAVGASWEEGWGTSPGGVMVV